MAEGIPASRVPQGVEAATQLVKGRDTSDIMLLVLLPVGATTALYMLELLTFRGMGIAIIGIGAVNWGIFTIIPNEESVSYWVRSYVGFKRDSNVLLKEGHNIEEIDEEMKIDYKETGGRDITNDDVDDVLSTEETTQKLSRVEAIDTYNGVIKLTSGEYITAIRVVGMERNLIDTALKQKATQSYQSFLNTTDFNVAIKCTSTQFDVDGEVERYDERLDDEDVNNRPILRRVMKSKKQFVNQRIRSLGMNNRKFYVFIRVTSSDQSIDEGGPFNLDFIDPDSPIGRFLEKRMAGDSEDDEAGKTKDENLTEMATSRRRAVQRSLSQIRQCSTHELNGVELAKVTRNFYCNDGSRVDGWRSNPGVTMTDDTIKEAQMEAET